MCAIASKDTYDAHPISMSVISIVILIVDVYLDALSSAISIYSFDFASPLGTKTAHRRRYARVARRVLSSAPLAFWADINSVRIPRFPRWHKYAVCCPDVLCGALPSYECGVFVVVSRKEPKE